MGQPVETQAGHSELRGIFTAIGLTSAMLILWAGAQAVAVLSAVSVLRW